MKDLEASFFELVRQASTDLPADVEAALAQAKDIESDEGIRAVLDVILENVAGARTRSTPICP